MKKIRYYAIGHSYLLHGPFPGWQTSGEWGMAASEPDMDYFHRFQHYIRENFNYTIEAYAENHADYERCCVLGATRENYESSSSYQNMQNVIREFNPNLITLFLGDGNTVAKDYDSLKVLFDVLYEMVSKNKSEETVVLCAVMNQGVYENVCKPTAEKYGFIPVDMSFIHEKKGYENPYYAFENYPEYDMKVAEGAVEFRTHPGNLGHDKIAWRMFEHVRDVLPQAIARNDRQETYRYHRYMQKENKNFVIKTDPALDVQFYGFNLRQEEDGVTLSSAPGTGASVAADGFAIEADTFWITMKADADEEKPILELSVMTKNRTVVFEKDMVTSMSHTYKFDLSGIEEPIVAFRVSPRLEECLLQITALGFNH